MKIRYGFVSNSSTTSFSLFGLSLSEEELQNYKIKDFYELETKLSEIKEDVECFSHPHCEQIYLGIPWHTIADNETGKEFKDKTIEILKRVFPDISDDKFGLVEDGWYDG